MSAHFMHAANLLRRQERLPRLSVPKCRWRGLVVLFLLSCLSLRLCFLCRYTGATETSFTIVCALLDMCHSQISGCSCIHIYIFYLGP
jgi:hypothetical protein